MFECGDLCMPVNWTIDHSISYLKPQDSRNLITKQRVQHGDVLLFLRWLANRQGESGRQLAQLMLSDGSIVMLYDGEFQKI